MIVTKKSFLEMNCLYLPLRTLLYGCLLSDDMVFAGINCTYYAFQTYIINNLYSLAVT